MTNNKINFTGIDGINYSFDFTLATMPEDEKPLDQYENLIKIQEIISNPDRTEGDLIRLHRVFFELFIKDFLLAYPNHILAKYFDPIEGLTSEGQVKVARFIGNIKNVENLMNQFTNAISGVSNYEPNRAIKRANKRKNIEILNEDREGHSEDNIQQITLGNE